MTRVVHVFGDEPYDVYIGRGRDPKTGAWHGTILTGKVGDYGNPWSHKSGTLAQYQVATVEEAIAKFRQYVMGRPDLQLLIRRHLTGKTLACWCKSKKNPNAPCHGDVLAEICDGQNS